MRFLCLHGMGTNAKIFEIQTSKLRLAVGGEHEFIFVDGNVPATPAPGKHMQEYPSLNGRPLGAMLQHFLKRAGVKQFASPDDEFLCFAEEGDVQGYRTLYNDLKELARSEKPFDGVMGFSEGAGVAASLIIDHIRETTNGRLSPFSFKCGIFFCAANPVDAAAAESGVVRVIKEATDGKVIDIPTAHIWARKDNVHAGFGSILSTICQPAIMEEVVHDYGHVIPGAQSNEGLAEAARAVRRTIERATDISYQETYGRGESWAVSR